MITKNEIKLRIFRLPAIIGFLAFSKIAAIAQETNHFRIYEGYPDKVQARLTARLSALRPIIPKGYSINAVINESSRWTTKSRTYVLTVAFYGGDSALQGDIARVASEWTNYGNVVFDFGYDPKTDTYRHWTSTDKQYAAQIRVSFDQPGYWSYVGNQSIDPNLTKPSEASLNLEAFNTQERPEQWSNIVLHEFGHALGFEHEHQSPAGGCESEFRWEDDVGYIPTRGPYGQFITDLNGKIPGIYTVLGGPPNNWSREKVDQNLRQIKDSRAFPVGPFDKTSIMEYHFDEWMYLNGRQSSCYSDENLDLSGGDKSGIAYLFPHEPTAITTAYKKQKDLVKTMIDQSAAAVKEQKNLQEQLMQMQKE